MPTEFATTGSRKGKATRGRTGVAATPLAIRTKLALPPGFADHVRARLGRQLGHGAPIIERGSVRFEDVNGPRGGVDIVCRLKLVVSGRPSVQVEGRGTTAPLAFSRAIAKLTQAFERTRGKHGISTRSTTGMSSRRPPRAQARRTGRTTTKRRRTKSAGTATRARAAGGARSPRRRAPR